MKSIFNHTYIKSYPKIIFFSLVILFSHVFISCDSDTNLNQVLPYVPPTNITINLDYPNFFDLQTTGEAVLIKEYLGVKVGYKGHGIIVIKVFDGEYKAWDASSTYDFNTTLTVKGSLGTCPKSDIEYNLLNGIPFEKDGDKNKTIKEVSPLQPYYCKKISENKLKISDKGF